MAAASTVDVATLPYDEELLEWLRHEKAAGRRLVLATASHRRLADAVAQHLNLFDEVMATEGDCNLKSARKRAALVDRFGERRFDYVGNSSADVPRVAGRAAGARSGGGWATAGKGREICRGRQSLPW